MQSDVRRLFQLTKSTSSAAHPFSKFSTGNLQTLSAAHKPHEAVMAFYREHYLAPKMHLSVIGRESLDELEAHVIRCFAGLRTAPDPQGAAAPAYAAADAPTRELTNGARANGAKDEDAYLVRYCLNPDHPYSEIAPLLWPSAVESLVDPLKPWGVIFL